MYPRSCIFILLSTSRIGVWAFCFVLLYPSGMHFSRSTVNLRPGSGWSPRNVRSESVGSYQIMASRQWSFCLCKIKNWTQGTLRVFQLEHSIFINKQGKPDPNWWFSKTSRFYRAPGKFGHTRHISLMCISSLLRPFQGQNWGWGSRTCEK